MRVAALIKQIPDYEELELGPDGRLRRDGLGVELNPYCRRAVSQAVAFAMSAVAAGDPSSVTFVTLGPPAAEDSLREALAWARARGVPGEGILVTDRGFAGSDTLATARALAATLRREGPFDLVLVGRNSVDADTGQVGPQVAELLDVAFLGSVRHVHLERGVVRARCETDDGWLQAEASLPMVLATAERLIDPCKVDPSERALVPAGLIRTLTAKDLGPGPWGAVGSPTSVGPVRVHEVERDRIVLHGPVDVQVRHAIAHLVRREALTGEHDTAREQVAATTGTCTGPVVAVVIEPDRPRVASELLGTAASLAQQIDGTVTAVAFESIDPVLLGSWGADGAAVAEGVTTEEDAATALGAWAQQTNPWAMLVPSTTWGREVAGRTAARLEAGLTGDAVAFEVQGGRLVAWKPAFGGQLVAAIRAASRTQMATVRVGVLPTMAPRSATSIPVTALTVTPRGRVRALVRTRDDDLDLLVEATAVVGVGAAIAPEDYPKLDGLVSLLGAELGATRKVTDRGWLPHARQIGITGRSIKPRLYVAVGLSGKFNHIIGVREAHTILAINPDPTAVVRDAADITIEGDWDQAIPLLTAGLAPLIRAETALAP